MKKINYKDLLNKEYKVLNTPDIDSIDFQVFVKELRKKTNMSQISFAKALGVAPNTVEKWEMGINKVSNATKRLLYLLDDNPDLMKKLYSVSVVKTKTQEYKKMKKVFIE